MKCQHCGASVVEGAAFCHVCGGQLSGAAAAPPVAAAAAVEEMAPRERFTSAANRESNGNDAEQVLWQGQFSKFAMAGAWISAGVFTIALLVVAAVFQFTANAWMLTIAAIGLVWIALLLRLLYQQLSIRYMLTNQRLVHERGLLWRSIDRIEVIDVDDVTFIQGPIERMMGIGTVKVVSSDQSTPEFNLIGIEDVRNVATMIDNARRQERRKRGLHIESV
ncbi:MAG: PH domain-containing protein [Pirellulales bacterium]|nr:PH domain-containing protein [Pirellulales bacterium]